MKADGPLAQGDHLRKSVEYYTEQLDSELPPEKAALLLTNLARIYLTLNEPIDALSCVDNSIVLQPSLERAYVLKGKILCQLGRHATAVSHYDRMAKEFPANQVHYMQDKVNAILVMEQLVNEGLLSCHSDNVEECSTVEKKQATNSIEQYMQTHNPISVDAAVKWNGPLGLRAMLAHLRNIITCRRKNSSSRNSATVCPSSKDASTGPCSGRTIAGSSFS